MSSNSKVQSPKSAPLASDVTLQLSESPGDEGLGGRPCEVGQSAQSSEHRSLKTPPKTYGQIKAIMAIAKANRIDHDTLADTIEDVTRRTRSKADLTYSEANRVIARLKGNAYVPLRTLQHRRQRAGIKQLVTQDLLNKIVALAAQRNWSAETLANFCQRQCGHAKPLTTNHANSVIEALKDMNQREGLWAA